MSYAYDPELALFAPVFAQLSFADIPAARAGEAELLAALPPYDAPIPLEIDELLVPGPEGAPEVRVRRYRPADQDRPLPALVYVHGGGFVVGSLDLYDADCRRFAAEVGAVVVSVDYRLAPEHPFPAGLEDCYAALVWVAENAEQLGVDPDRIAVGGESAGGGLSAGLALLARWDSYLGEGVRGTDRVSPYAAPARATDLTGLPPAFVTAYEFDGLRDEGIAYAQRLMAAGVPTELHVYPGAFHSCTWLSQAALCRKILGDLVDALGRGLRSQVGQDAGR